MELVEQRMEVDEEEGCIGRGDDSHSKVDPCAYSMYKSCIYSGIGAEPSALAVECHPVYVALRGYSSSFEYGQFWRELHGEPVDGEQQSRMAQKFICEQLTNASAQNKEEIVQAIVHWSKDRNANQPHHQLVFEVLRYACDEGILPLNLTDFSLAHGVHGPSFEFVRSHLGDIDYKGVRDLLKMMLEKLNSSTTVVPLALTRRQQRMFAHIGRLIEAIVDREANFLPAYFVINELSRMQQTHTTKVFHIAQVSTAFANVMNSFRPLAELVSIIGRPFMVPVVGHATLSPWHQNWKLESGNHRLSMKGFLPYALEYTVPQNYIIAQLIKQPRCREAVGFVLDMSQINKTPCISDVLAMLVSECIQTPLSSSPQENQSMRHYISHLSYQMFSFCIAANSSAILQRFLQQLRKSVVANAAGMTPRRDDLMWILHQILVMVSAKLQTDEIFAVIAMYEALYTGTEAVTASGANLRTVRAMSATGVWMLLIKRQSALQPNAPLKPPPSIKTAIEFLDAKIAEEKFNVSDDYLMAILLNTYTVSSDSKKLPSASVAHALWEKLDTKESSLMMPLPQGPHAPKRVRPLDYEFIDSLSINTHVYLAKLLVNALNEHMVDPQSGVSPPSLPSPALLETLARFMISDTEHARDLTLKTISNSYLPAVGNSVLQTSSDLLQKSPLPPTANAPYLCAMLAVAHMYIELLSFRMHPQHMQSNRRMQLICQLHGGMGHMIVEHCLLRHLHFLSPVDMCHSFKTARTMQPLFTALAQPYKHGDPPSAYQEEFTRSVIVALARNVQIAGQHVGGGGVGSDLFASLGAQLAWPPCVLRPMSQNTRDALIEGQEENLANTERQRVVLMEQLKEEYSKMIGFHRDQFLNYATRPNPYPVFLCLFFQLLLEHRRLPVMFDVADRLPAQIYAANISSLANFLLKQLSGVMFMPGDDKEYVESASIVTSMVFEHSLLPLERLLLALLQCPSTDHECHIMLRYIDVILRTSQQFKDRLQLIIDTIPAQHWLCPDMSTRLREYYQQFPEPLLSANASRDAEPPYNAVYFGHMALRMLPVSDMILERALCHPRVVKEEFYSLLHTLAPLYRYHPMPMTFLYRTLHFLEPVLRGETEARRQFVLRIASNVTDTAFAGVRTNASQSSSEGDPNVDPQAVHAPLYMFSDEFQTASTSESAWMVGVDYYVRLIERSATAVDGWAARGCTADWKLCEMSNSQLWAINVCAVEIMAMTVDPAYVTQCFLAVIHEFNPRCSEEVDESLPNTGPPLTFYDMCNAASLILTALPPVFVESLWSFVEEELGQLHDLCLPQHLCLPFDVIPAARPMRTLALVHNVLQHCTQHEMAMLPGIYRTRLCPLVRTETQLMFLLRLAVPFMMRMSADNHSSSVIEIAIDIYTMIGRVDAIAPLTMEDTIADLCFHMKYQFVGVGCREEADPIVANMRPSLREKLKFISSNPSGPKTSTV